MHWKPGTVYLIRKQDNEGCSANTSCADWTRRFVLQPVASAGMHFFFGCKMRLKGACEPVATMARSWRAAHCAHIYQAASPYDSACEQDGHVAPPA